MPLTATIAHRGRASTAASNASAPRADAPRPRRPPGQLRAARRAGVGLGVEATVGGVVVLGLAGRAHREAGHRGGRPVVGHVEHDRVPRPAVRAVGERVAVAAVAGVVDLGQAVGAGGAVDAHGHVGRAGTVARRRCGSRRGARRRGALGDHRRHPGQRWRRRRPAAGRARRSGRAALDVDQHAGAVVADGAGQPERHRVPVHEGPEPDALHRAGHPQPSPDELGRAEGRCGHRLSRSAGAGRRRACRRCGCRRTTCSSTTMPSGSAATSPMRVAPAPERVGPQGGQRGVGLLGRDHRDDLALVGDVERVDAEQVARAGHRRRDRQQRLVEHHGKVRRRGPARCTRCPPLPASGPAATASTARRRAGPRPARSPPRCRTGCRHRAPGRRGPA